jgi:hypothetical protein
VGEESHQDDDEEDEEEEEDTERLPTDQRQGSEGGVCSPLVDLTGTSEEEQPPGNEPTGETSDDETQSSQAVREAARHLREQALRPAEKHRPLEDGETNDSGVIEVACSLPQNNQAAEGHQQQGDEEEDDDDDDSQKSAILVISSPKLPRKQSEVPGHNPGDVSDSETEVNAHCFLPRTRIDLQY